jgi:hypothetical protein
MNINIYTMFYVYTYLREDRTPYYVGKGSGERAFKKWGKGIKPPKDLSRIVIVEDNLDEQTAFDLERKLIAEYGRKDLGTGILYNMTDGGEGPSGHKTRGWTWSEESKAKRRGSGNPAFGKKQSPESQQKKREKMQGHKWSEETQAKRTASLQNRKVTWGDKVSAALKGRKQDPAVVAKRAESCRQTWAAKKALNT